MIERTRHDDVTAVRLTWWRSRVVGYGVHVYLVRGVLVDSGFPAVAEDIRTLVADQRGVGGDALRGAMITHQHEDHAGNVALLAALGVPMAMHPETLAETRGPHAIGFYRHFTWRAMPPLAAPIAPFADEALSLVPTPGHSADHCVVWDARTATLFAGDLFLGVKVRVAHPYESPRAQVASLRAMIAREPARVFCAHRGLVPDGTAMLRAKAEWMTETIGRIETLVQQGIDDTRIIRQRVLGGRPSTHWFSAGDYSPDNLVRAIVAGR